MDNRRSNPPRAGRAFTSSERDPRASVRRYDRQSDAYQGRGAHAASYTGATPSSAPAGRERSIDRQYSSARQTSRDGYARERVRRKRRKRLYVAIAAVLIICLGGAGAAFGYLDILEKNMHKGIDDDLRGSLVHTDLANEPFYVLLMGTDGSSDREASAEFEGDQFRSDSIMLARVDPVDKKVTLVSIHRDTRVDMGEYGVNKLNAAHALGGAKLAVETVSELAEVPISHYAEINFDGFKDIVDALGGVEVDVPIQIDDEDAGGHLDKGLQTLNGDQALILCRSRHSYDDYGDGDSYRAANQRLVLSAIAKKLLSADVATMASTITALSNYVTTDLSLNDIIGIAQSMQGLDPSTDIYSGMEPTTSVYTGGVWYEINDTDAWRKMMDRVDRGLPPTEDDIVDEESGTILATTGSGEPSNDGGASSRKTGTVAIRNGNGLSGAGLEAASKIEDQGYTVDTGNADSFDYPRTLVIYDEAGQADEARGIASSLGVGEAQVNDGSYSFDTDFLVVLGADWHQ